MLLKTGGTSAAADIFKAHVRCKVRKVLLIARKGYTGGVFAMAGGGFKPTATLAYPHAHVGVFSMETLHKIMDRYVFDAEQKRVVEQLGEEITSPEVLMEKGLISEVIQPEDTRATLEKYLFLNRARNRDGASC